MVDLVMEWFRTTFDEPVNETLKNSKLTCRYHASSAPWLSLLLPTAVVIGATWTQEASEQHQIAAVIATGMFGAAAALLLHLIKTNSSPKAFSLLFFCPASLTSLLLLVHSQRGIMFSLIGGIISTFPFCAGVPLLLQLLPGAFTYGEACVVVQGAVLFMFTSILNICTRLFDTHLDAMMKATLILQAGLLGLAAVGISVATLPSLRQIRPFCALMVGILGGAVVPALCIIMRENPVLWMFHFILDDLERVYLLLYWLVCSGVAVIAVCTQVQDKQQASTGVRKTFHLLMLAVYIPGLAWECTLLYLASGIALAALITLEMIRLLKLGSVGESLQQGFLVFADEKDQGGVSLTPLYLLVGCSAPLWLHPSRCTLRASLPMLAGLLSVGAGDTAASVIGFNFGEHKWQGSKKSKEGTVACAVAQLILIVLLTYIGFLPFTLYSLLKSLFAVVTVSIAEALTDQVDNLVLPLIMYILLL